MKNCSYKLINRILAASLLLVLVFISDQRYYSGRLRLAGKNNSTFTVWYMERSAGPLYKVDIKDSDELDIMYAFVKSLRKVSAIERLNNRSTHAFLLDSGNGHYSIAFDYGRPDFEQEKLLYVVRAVGIGRDQTVKDGETWLFRSNDEELYNAALEIVARYKEEMVPAGQQVPK